MRFFEDFKTGADQPEVAKLMDKIEPALVGHSRSIVVMAATRMIAGMLGPARRDTREVALYDVPRIIRDILHQMDSALSRQEPPFAPDVDINGDDIRPIDP